MFNQIVGVNVVGMRRAGYSHDEINAVRQAYRIIFREGSTHLTLHTLQLALNLRANALKLPFYTGELAPQLFHGGFIAALEKEPRRSGRRDASAGLSGQPRERKRKFLARLCRTATNGYGRPAAEKMDHARRCLLSARQPAAAENRSAEAGACGAGVYYQGHATAEENH